MAEKKLTREEARELYDDMHRAMTQMMAKKGQQPPHARGVSSDNQSKVAKDIADAIRGGLNGAKPSTLTSKERPASKVSNDTRLTSPQAAMRGRMRAVMVVAALGCAKIALSALQASGIGEVEVAHAVVAPPPVVGPQWSKEEVKVLTALDNRRAELEERSARVDRREMELAARDRDVAVRLADLKELTEKLKIEREKGDKQRNNQLDQLANVYGSMNPPEAAHLLEQLDIQVALSLIQRMPEKRMGQILALMNAQRALELTNMLSNRGRVGK
jgi:flagellar motility protein MotE (MotC chaperone)